MKQGPQITRPTINTDSTPVGADLRVRPVQVSEG